MATTTRSGCLVVLSCLALAATGCGGDPGGAVHPVLDQDFTAGFVGRWSGSGTVTRAGANESFSGFQEITRTGFNTLSLANVCPGVTGTAGLDGPATFSVDPLRCPPVVQACGAVTFTYDRGTGQLQDGNLTITLQGTAVGCGRWSPLTVRFTGTQPRPEGDGAPIAVVAPARAEVDAGAPVSLDATGSEDPDGGALAFSWTVAAQPAGASATLTGAATATPTFSSTVPGAYRLALVATAPDGRTGAAVVPVLVRPPATVSYVYLESDPGDFVGAGRSYFYTNADAVLAPSGSGGVLWLDVRGDERWGGYFAEPGSPSQLEPGLYGPLSRRPAEDPARGGLDWSGEGRACGATTGWFAVDEVAYSGSALEALELRFEQRCEGGEGALRGRVRWYAGDATRPPGPVSPPPAGLWQPPPGSTPERGSYVYLESDPGDRVGGGRTYVYTQADASLSVTAGGRRAAVTVRGDESWSGNFEAMSTVAALEPGYYADARSYPPLNPTRAGLDWSGGAPSCGAVTGWFVVDGIAGSGTAVTALDVRFEQRCEGAGPALRGRIHWDASDPTEPPGPTSPPPDLWRPAPGATPETGSFVYLESDPGDWVGAGGVYLYTQADAVLVVAASVGGASASVTGDEWWDGEFRAMSTLSELEPGYYGNLQRHPLHNPARGGLAWSGDGRGCETLTGWFVVDAATYSGGTLTALDLRFEQRCDGAQPALRGRLRWDASDPTRPPGPVTPPPAQLWRAPAGSAPASGSYVYLQSDPGDFVGEGQTRIFTDVDGVFALTAYGALLDVSVAVGDVQSARGSFQAMDALSRLEPGYYPSLQRHPFHNPTRGGLDWSMNGNGCNELTGWFAVDDVAYDGDTLTAIDLRFEQHCERAVPALHGQLHWSAQGG